MKKLIIITTAVFVVIVIAGILLFVPSDSSASKDVKLARLSLHQQGFKTDLADFNFLSSHELLAREDILKTALADDGDRLAPEFPNLQEITASNSVVVIWQQKSLFGDYSGHSGGGDRLSWEEFQQMLEPDQPQLDAATAAILSGPVSFNLDARAGNAMLLPHLAPLKSLTQMLGRRSIVDLHKGDLDAAWTNLMAATRLVTAWNPEPVEMSHLVRFANANLAFNIIWQNLQAEGWPDDRLARLQKEWESADFFKDLPETVAFQRACTFATFEQERLAPTVTGGGYSHSDWLRELINHPSATWLQLSLKWKYNSYRQHGIFEDEANLLITYRDRELEFQKAVQASNWSQMQGLPGVTNEFFFETKNPSVTLTTMRIRKASLAFAQQGKSFLGRAAEAESQRRIIITAIALERYRLRHGSYPQDLTVLSPDPLKRVPADFMDGKPLRYQLTDDGHFILYSIGPDGIDHGGILPIPAEHNGLIFTPRSAGVNLIWPRPASDSETLALRKKQFAARRGLLDQGEEWQSSAQWDHTARHQLDAEKLLASASQYNQPEIYLNGQPLSELLRNATASGTNRLTLRQMLTPKQLITGDEPELATFELPLAYDVLTKVGELYLLVDTNNDEFNGGNLAQQMECTRAGNGNCRLKWSTIYECPGEHAVQVGLNSYDPNARGLAICGPYVPFVITNLCQFSLSSAHFDEDVGATFRAKLLEPNASYAIDILTTNGTRIKTLTGSTATGILNTYWNLMDEHGQRMTNNFFNSVIHLKLTDSGREQTLKGP